MVGDDISPYTSRTTPPATGAVLGEPWISAYVSGDVSPAADFVLPAAASSAMRLPGISMTPAFFVLTWTLETSICCPPADVDTASEDEEEEEEEDFAVAGLTSDFWSLDALASEDKVSVPLAALRSFSMPRPGEMAPWGEALAEPVALELGELNC